MRTSTGCRAELRRGDDGTQIWIGADGPAGLASFRNLIAGIVERSEHLVTLSSAPNIEISGFTEIRFKLAQEVGSIWPALSSDRDPGCFRWVGSREDWLMCRDLIDEVINSSGPGFQVLTGNADDAADFRVERLA